LVSKEEKKIERVINFMKKGLTSLADDLGETVKGINDFIKSLSKAQKDLKEITVGGEVKTVSTSSKKIVAPTTGSAKTAAASTLFSLLSGSGESQAATAPAATAAVAAPIPAAPAPPTSGGPPKAPTGVPTGPPKAPPSSGPPKAPKAGNLPPAPKLPPSGPPKAPTGVPTGPPKSSGPPQAPSFAKRPGVPPAAAAAPAAAPQAGGGLSSLRDEMLDELNRLKKIMRGEE
jgi:hypothetical protein